MRPKHFLWAGITLFLFLLPIANLAGILLTTGADTISNDYLLYLRQVDRFLLGENDWRQYFKETLFSDVHSYAVLFPVRLALLKLTNLRVSAEITAGFILAAARVGLLYALLTMFLPKNPQPLPRRLWLLPAISALVFSFGQISTFGYGETALQFGIIQPAILTGVWLLLRFPQSTASAWGAAMCGIVASYSGGSGLMAWPVFLLAILWTDRRSPRKYFAWLIGMIIALGPYIAYSAFRPAAGWLNSFQPLRPELLLIGIGLPFSSHINFGVLKHEQALLLGSSGLVLLGVSVFFLYRFRRCELKLRAAPALLMSLWAFFNALQIMVARETVAPWYNPSYILFWIGLVGLAPIFFEPGQMAGSIDQPENRLIHIYLPTWAAGVLAFTFFLYAQSNLTYEDKAFYLASRSPASVACLRNYRTAPTYCEGMVFQWGVGHPGYLQEAALILDRHNLSIFGSRQELTLQGDYILGAVDWLWEPGLAVPVFTRDARDEPASWADYHHLNLLVPPGQIVRWQVSLPEQFNGARLVTAISRQGGGKCTSNGVLSIAVHHLISQAELSREVIDACHLGGQGTVEIDLTNFAGQQIWLEFDYQNAAGGEGTIRLHYPRIIIDEVSGGLTFTPNLPVQPANTELSPRSRPVDATALRYLFGNGEEDLLKSLEWDQDNQRFSVTGLNPLIRRTVNSPACLLSRSHFYVKMAMPDTFAQKTTLLSFKYMEGTGASGTRGFDLPLLGGAEHHTYTVDLNLLNLPASACITEFTIQAPTREDEPPGDWLDLEEAGFLLRQKISSAR